MTAFLPAREPGWTSAAENGCTGTVDFGLRCRSQQTVTLDSLNGRRCSEHSPAVRPLTEENAA